MSAPSPPLTLSRDQETIAHVSNRSLAIRSRTNPAADIRFLRTSARVKNRPKQPRSGAIRNHGGKGGFPQVKAEKPEGVSAEQAFRCGEKAFQPGEITSVPGIALSGGFPAEGGLRHHGADDRPEVQAISQEGSPLKGD